MLEIVILLKALGAYVFTFHLCESYLPQIDLWIGNTLFIKRFHFILFPKGNLSNLFYTKKSIILKISIINKHKWLILLMIINLEILLQKENISIKRSSKIKLKLKITKSPNQEYLNNSQMNDFNYLNNINLWY